MIDPKTAGGRRRPAGPHWCAGAWVAAALLAVWPPTPSLALEMNSASFSSRAGATNAGSIAQTSSAASPAFSAAAGSVGQREAVGLTGSASSLRTARAGFWPIVVQDIASLDLDGDGIQSFFDPDDDNDGLDDVVETNTGVYVSPLDTGSDPLDPDSDGDGVDDGTEVALGRDPNVDESTLPVPSLSVFGRRLAVLGLGLAGAVALRRAAGKERRIP